MAFLIKHKKNIRIVISLLAIPFVVLQLLALTAGRASASDISGLCYHIDQTTDSLTTFTCPTDKVPAAPDGNMISLNGTDWYYAEAPTGSTIEQYQQESCTTLACQSNSIPADVNCTPSDPCDPGSPDADNALCSHIVQDYINPVILFLGAGVGLIIVIMTVIGGIQYITSGGDAQHVADAKKRIFNALLALVAWLLIFMFLQWIIPGGILY